MHQEDKIEKITFGNATFKNIPKRIIKVREKSKWVQSTLKKDQWYIVQGRYETQKWPQILPYMSECHAKEMYLYSNNRVQIISQIQHVQFINLKWLNLAKNKINNIQSLCFIHFNCLQTLCLDFNQISQIKSLKKLSAPFLNGQFSICQNPLNQINALIKSQINQKSLYRLQLQLDQQQNPLHQDLSCLIKISSKSVNKVYVNQKKRIKQVKVLSMLELRFPGIQTDPQF